MKDNDKTKEQLEENNQQLRASEQQLKATNQQLRASEQQLNAANQQLEAGNQKLREGEARFRGVFECGMMGTLFWNAEGDIIDANDTFLDMVGHSRDEVISGKIRWRDMTPPEYADLDNKALQEIADTGAMTPLEKEYIRKDGSRIPILLGAASLPGPMLNGVAFVLDITERKQVEERLKHTTDILEAIRKANQVIIRENDLDPLIDGICKNLMETRNYFNVWISLFDEKGSIKTVSSRGVGKNFSSVKKLLKEGKRVLCQKRALKKEGVLVIDAPFKTCQDCPLAPKYKGRAALIHRLEYQGTIYGTITISIRKDLAKDDNEKHLFHELAGDISRGLHGIENNEKRENAEKNLKATIQQLIASEQQLKAAIQQLSASEQQLKATNQQLTASEQQLLIKNKIANIFLTVPDNKMFDEVLKLQLEVFQSQFGVVGYLNDAGDLVVPTMTRHIWKKCQVPDKDIVFPRKHWGRSSWPKAIREKKIYYSNTPSDLIPKGHIPITRHMSVPIVFRGKVIGLYQVANKDSDYTKDDIYHAQIFGDNLAAMLNARLQRDKYESERKQAEEKLKATIQQLVASEQQLKAAIQQLSASEQQLKATNQQLMASEQQLRAANQQLMASEQQLKTANRQLREKDKELRLKNIVFESSITANSISDNNGIITHANPGFLKVWGYDSIEEIIGKPIPNFIKNEEEALAIVTALSETGEWEGEYVGLKKDGSTFNAYGLATIIQNERGENIGYQSAVLDITDRKEMESELGKHRENLEDLIKARTLELEEKNTELERFYDATVSREFRMKDLRNQIEELEKKLGERSE